MIPHITLDTFAKTEDALIVIMAILIADDKITVGGSWHRLDEVTSLAAEITAGRAAK